MPSTSMGVDAPNALRLGDSVVSRVYAGDTLVYAVGTDGLPLFDFASGAWLKSGDAISFNLGWPYVRFGAISSDGTRAVYRVKSGSPTTQRLVSSTPGSATHETIKDYGDYTDGTYAPGPVAVSEDGATVAVVVDQYGNISTKKFEVWRKESSSWSLKHSSDLTAITASHARCGVSGDGRTVVAAAGGTVSVREDGGSGSFSQTYSSNDVYTLDNTSFCAISGDGDTIAHTATDGSKPVVQILRRTSSGWAAAETIATDLTTVISYPSQPVKDFAWNLGLSSDGNSFLGTSRQWLGTPEYFFQVWDYSSASQAWSEREPLGNRQGNSTASVQSGDFISSAALSGNGNVVVMEPGVVYYWSGEGWVKSDASDYLNAQIVSVSHDGRKVLGPHLSNLDQTLLEWSN